MRAHIIRNGIVENTIEIESLDKIPELEPFLRDASLGGQKGDLWDGENFTTPPFIEPVPMSVTPKQARLAMLGAGILTAVESAIAGMEGEQGQAARIIWEFAQEIKRTDPLVLQLSAGLGLTSEQVDALFVAAGKL
jgi:hypothetical protein